MTTITRRLHRIEEGLTGPEAELSRRLRERFGAAPLISSLPETLYDRLIAANRAAQQILHVAMEMGQPGLALMAIARVEKQLELLARLLGDLDDSTKVAVGLQVNAAGADEWDLSKLTAAEAVELDRLLDKARK